MGDYEKTPWDRQREWDAEQKSKMLEYADRDVLADILSPWFIGNKRVMLGIISAIQADGFRRHRG